MQDKKRLSAGFILISFLFLIFNSNILCEEQDKSGPEVLELGDIIVTPSRIEQYYRTSSVNVSVVKEKEIKRSGAIEISQLLDTLPSVNIIDYGSLGAAKSIYTRGASSSQVITLIDGRIVNTPRDGVADYNQIPLDNIERIEVLRGPASSIYGAGAVGGVINIVTKSGKERMFTEMNLKSGSFFTHILNFSHGWKIGALDYFIYSSYLESDGHRENSDYQQNNHSVKLGYDIDDKNRLLLQAGYVDSELGTPGKNSNVDLDDRQEQWRYYIDLTWRGSIWRKSDILFKLYQDLDRLEFIESLSPILVKDAHQTKVYGIDLQITQIWFDIFRTSFGLSAQENKINSTANQKRSYNLKAAYLETEFDLFKEFFLKAGIRIDDYSNFGDRTTPSASFSWLLWDRYKLHGLVAKAFRAPTFNDLYWPRGGGLEGNPNLKPELALSRELGVSFYLFNKMEGDITYFRNRFKDLIEWAVDNTGSWRPSNISTALTKGIEADFTYRLNKSFKLNVNYTRMIAKNTSTDRWLPYRPKHQYKAKVSYDLGKNFSVYLTARYLSDRYTGVYTPKLKSYFVMDGNISYKITDKMKVELTVNNILDQDYEEQVGYPMPPTTIYISTTWQY